MTWRFRGGCEELHHRPTPSAPLMSPVRSQVASKRQVLIVQKANDKKGRSFGASEHSNINPAVRSVDHGPVMVEIDQ